MIETNGLSGPITMEVTVVGERAARHEISEDNERAVSSEFSDREEWVEKSESTVIMIGPMTVITP